MNNQLKFLNRGISTSVGAIIILAAFLAGGILAWQYFGTPKESVKDETADWKTYNNENGGYTIKYPSDLLIKHTVAEEGKTWPNFVDSLEMNSQDRSTNPAHWRIEVWENKDGLTAQQRIDQIGGVTPTRNKVITKITVDGIEGRKVVIDYLPSDVDPENTIETATSIFIIKGEDIYEFYCGIQDCDSYRFNQMFSTFRFLE